MSLSRTAAAEHYPAAGQTGKPMCGSLPRNRKQTFRELPGNDSGIRERDCGRCIIVLKQT